MRRRRASRSAHSASMLSGLNAGNQERQGHETSWPRIRFNAVRLERRKSGLVGAEAEKAAF